MARRPLMAGNWKMNKTPSETEAFLATFVGHVRDASAEILLIPAFPSLDRAHRLLAGTRIQLGAQDVHSEPNGAYTGAVSGEMLRDVGCTYVLVGHSERRHVFGDDDERVRAKLEAALRSGLLPILCVGERLDARRAEATEEVVSKQLRTGMDGLSVDDANRVTIAYEPVWAIGTGETATPDQAQETIRFIRQWLEGSFSADLAETTRILYGGSVKPDNAAALLAQPDLDGALVGGASLDPESFVRIVAAAEGSDAR